MALNDRGFSHLQLIPQDLSPEFIDVQITNVYTDIKVVPSKLKFGHWLSLLKMVMNPLRVLFVKEL